jgi:6-phosphogluconolactonase
MALDRQFFTDRAALTTALADTVCTALSGAIGERGRASLAVSGGSTPRPLFEALASRELAWERVTVLPVDERWVNPDDPDANERLIRASLLQGRAAAAAFIGMKTETGDPRAAEDACSERLRPFFPLDLVLLGMGGDGHTASLFPDALRLDEALEEENEKICMAITPPAAPHKRMSLTLAALLRSRAIVVHIVGKEKKAVLDQALAPGPVRDMPIRAIFRQSRVPVTIFWAP